MRYLITGGGGQLASDLGDLLGDAAEVRSRAELDITDTPGLEHALQESAPDVVINCAAYHNLDECEAHAERAFAVNVAAVAELARRAPRLVHVSTNYVFDGEREAPYAEDDLPAPRSIYALTKLAGEHAALAYGSAALVVRTGGLYGLEGSASKGGNFVQRMLRRAASGEPVRMVADQRLQPTFTADLAAGILAAVDGGVDGVLHLTASGACSWYEFTRTIMANAGIDIEIEPVTTTRQAGAVHRPLNGVLARPAADAAGLAPLRPWAEALDDYMGRASLKAPTVLATEGDR